MRQWGLKAVIRKRWSIRKYIKENVASNVLNRELKTEKPFKKLVCEVTEMRRVNNQRYYVFSVRDLYNNAIICACMSELRTGGLKLFPVNPRKYGFIRIRVQRLLQRRIIN